MAAGGTAAAFANAVEDSERKCTHVVVRVECSVCYKIDTHYPHGSHRGEGARNLSYTYLKRAIERHPESFRRSLDMRRTMPMEGENARVPLSDASHSSGLWVVHEY